MRCLLEWSPRPTEDCYRRGITEDVRNVPRNPSEREQASFFKNYRAINETNLSIPSAPLACAFSCRYCTTISSLPGLDTNKKIITLYVAFWSSAVINYFNKINDCNKDRKEMYILYFYGDTFLYPMGDRYTDFQVSSYPTSLV